MYLLGVAFHVRFGWWMFCKQFLILDYCLEKAYPICNVYAGLARLSVRQKLDSCEKLGISPVAATARLQDLDTVSQDWLNSLHICIHHSASKLGCVDDVASTNSGRARTLSGEGLQSKLYKCYLYKCYNLIYVMKILLPYKNTYFNTNKCYMLSVMRCLAPSFVILIL